MTQTKQLAIALLLGFTLAPQLVAIEPKTLVAVQDEPQELPSENTAFFFAAREVSVRLDLLAAMEESSIQDTLVTVVRPSGETTDLIPNADGEITIEDVEAGPHALVANSRMAHGTKLLYLEAQPEMEILEDNSEPVELTMLEIRAKQLRPIVEEIRDVGHGESLVVADDPPRVRQEPYDYQVLLGPDGSLNGIVINVESKPINLEGTHITLFRDGRVVGSTYSDAQGLFTIGNVGPGVHGIIASGAAGYAAVAIEAVDPDSVVMSNTAGERFVTMMDPVDRCPVVLCPPPFVPQIVESISDFYTTIPGEAPPAAPAGEPIGLPMAGSMVPASPAPGSFGGGGFSGGGGGGGFGGGGALIGVAAIGGLIAAANNSSDDNRFLIATPPVASPAIPVSN